MEEHSDQNIDRARGIELLLLDVDGTLSDGLLHYSADWIESKSFDVRDGFGIYLARTCGLKTGIVTGRNSRIVNERARELNVDLVYQGQFEKARILEKVASQIGLTRERIAFVGDDLFDLPLLLRVGFSAAPADAHEEVRRRVHFVSQYAGGRGAVREIIEFILKSRGQWDHIIQEFCQI